MKDGIHRARISIKGIVQGVGFRPFIYNLAMSMGMKGYVLNSSKGVVVDVEGINTDVFAKKSFLAPVACKDKRI